MHIALCTPISLDLFAAHVEHAQPMPLGYTYPLAFFLTMRLLDAGHRVTVVTSALDVQQRMDWTGFQGRLKVIATPRRRPRYTCLDVYRREVRAMRAELKAAAPDVIHAHWTYEFADAALSTGLLCVVTARDAPWLIAWYFREVYRIYRALYSSVWIVPRLRYFTAVSEHIGNVFSKEPFFRAKKVWVTPNGLDVKFFALNPKRHVSDCQAPVFFATSGWSYLKNLGTLLEAFSRVRRQVPAAQLKIVGAVQGEGGSLERKARKRNLFQGVTLLGILPYGQTLAVVESEADIVVHPTKEESFSMVVLEAMAKGVPVVGGRKSGAVPWLLAAGKAGVLVDINSPQSLAEGMLRLLSDRKLYAEMAQVAHQRALEHFTIDKVSGRFLQVYDEVLALNRSSLDGR